MTDNDCGYYEAKCSSLEDGYLKLQRENYKLEKENGQLKKELFELKKDYIIETYADNPIRRDERLKALKKELIE